MDKSSLISARTSLAYCAVAIAWILWSDRVLEHWFPDPVQLTIVQGYKGVLFVVITSLLLFFTLRAQLRRWQREVSRTLQAEKFVLEKNEILEKIFENAPVMLCFIDRDGRWKMTNREFQKTTGWSVEEMQNNPDFIAELYPDEPYRADVLAFIKAGRGEFKEFLIRTRDQKIITASFANVLLSDGTSIGLGIDITILKAAEKQSQLLAQRLRLATEAVSIGVWDWDLQSDTWFATPMYFTMLGYSPEEGFASRDLWMERVHPDDRAMVTSKISAALAGDKTPYEYEARVLHAQGMYRWIQVIGRVLTVDERGWAIRMLGVRIDVTARREIEEKIRELNVDLEQRVARRTEQLAAKSKELESFCYSVSHDLKAPLRGIDGYSQLLFEEYYDKIDPEGRQFIHNIRQATRQMGQLIDDLLAYSKLDRWDLSIGIMDLRTFIEAQIQARETDFKPVQLNINIGRVRVHADPAGLALAVRNLLDNALKFSTTATPPRIDIFAKEENGKAVLTIRDNGIGFDMRFHDKIFEIFQRLQRAEDSPGTGIGLALVRRAIERMGGRVWAESSPGAGAAFHLELPLAEPMPFLSTEPASPAPALPA